MVTVPLLANMVMAKPPFTGALWLLRLTGVIPLGAVLGGLALPVVGIRPVTVAGLAMVSLGLFLASTWDIGVGEPQLTLHLAAAGLGFGLVIAPIASRAINAVSQDYRGTAASLVVVARMLGMTLGLAALSAWGVEQFQVLTAGLDIATAPTGGKRRGLPEQTGGIHWSRRGRWIILVPELLPRGRRRSPGSGSRSPGNGGGAAGVKSFKPFYQPARHRPCSVLGYLRQ